MRETRTSGLMSGEGKRSGEDPPPRPSSTLPDGVYLQARMEPQAE